MRSNTFGGAVVTAAIVLLAAHTAHADLSISSKPTHDMSCSAGVCTPTAWDAVLNIGDLETMLASGDTTVQSGNGDHTAASIAIADGFSWTSVSRLTLTAKNDISVEAPVAIAGIGALTLTYAAGNPDGDLLFASGGRIDFRDLKSSLTINRIRYKLEGDLKSLAADACKPSHAVALANDYDASADGVYSTTPVGELTGVIEGQGHSFLNLNIQAGYQTNNGGLINTVYGGTVRDLNLTNINLQFSGDPNAGAIAGLVRDGTVIGCSVSGVVQGTLERGPNTGGLVGWLDGGSLIDRSRSTASVNGRGWIGGLVGFLEHGARVSRSYAEGSVTGRKKGTWGGLVGYNDGEILDSYATGSIQIQAHETKTPVLGGLVGDNHRGSVTTSYSVGQVQNIFYFGGFVGVELGHLTANYWDLDTSGVSDPAKGCSNIDNCPGVTGLSDAQLKSGLPSGFNPHISGTDPNINNGYPYLLANPPQ